LESIFQKSKVDDDPDISEAHKQIKTMQDKIKAKMKKNQEEELAKFTKEVEDCEAIRKSIKLELARCLAVIEKLANKELMKRDQAI